MRVEFLVPAQHELGEAVSFYDAQSPSLGDRFVREVVRALHRIQDFPRAWPRMSKRSRRCRLTKFHYGLVYQIRKDSVLIVAVMHLSRKPGYWRDREV
jgi:plasmid stabilization system protein ParE